MTTDFRNWGWWSPSFWLLATMHSQCNRCVLNRSPNYVSLRLAKIDQIVKKWQPCFEIQNGGGRHVELRLLRFFNVTDLFQIKVAIFLLNLAMTGHIVNKWQLFLEIQDGGDRHLEFRAPNQRRNICTKFIDDRSISNEMAITFRNPRWRRPPSWIFETAFLMSLICFKSKS